jgi:hydroxymethylpyrimidine/phosphomethylpyrimidine kinase
MQTYKYTSVLTIAGSDSGGGAGIQADLKTFAALGCYGTSAITAVTAQNTLGVTAIHPVPPHIIAAQITAVMDDIKPSAIKIGMLPDSDTVQMVADILRQYKDVPIIIDPVMASSTGTLLTTTAAISAMCIELFPLATLITPNIQEAAMLTGESIDTVEQMKKSAVQLLEFGSYAVLIKGSHLNEQTITHRYADKNNNQFELQSSFVDSQNTHGTGCTFSAAMSAYLARGETLEKALHLAEEFVHEAIFEGQQVKTGKGSGPLNHFFNPQKLITNKI